jgi:hypothetical protein
MIHDPCINRYDDDDDDDDNNNNNNNNTTNKIHTSLLK